MDRQRDRDAVPEEDLSRRRGEMLRREPPVERDDDALRRLAPLHDVVGDAVGAATDVLERVLVGDAGTPAVGPEDDRRAPSCRPVGPRDDEGSLADEDVASLPDHLAGADS